MVESNTQILDIQAATNSTKVSKLLREGLEQLIISEAISFVGKLTGSTVVAVYILVKE
jgi:hypothetical protein